MLADLLVSIYPWVKALHIVSVISWMAGLLYLPRLFVNHVEQANDIEGAASLFEMMEGKLLRVIMNPAMIATWVFGLILVSTPGIVDWSAIWPWTKAGSVVGMTWFHMWLAQQRRVIGSGRGALTGRQYRLMNEVPTVLMLVIVLSVVIKF